jgi:hypothetical protein
MLARMTSVTAPTPAASLLGAIQYAREGIARGVQGYEQAAQQVASATAAGGTAPVPATVGLLEARLQVAAAAKVLERADRGLGSLLDVRA